MAAHVTKNSATSAAFDHISVRIRLTEFCFGLAMVTCILQFEVPPPQYFLTNFLKMSLEVS